MDISVIFDVLQIPLRLQNVPPGLYGKPAKYLQNEMRDTAKENFRKLSMVYHPDHGGDNEKMRDLIEAFEQSREIVLIEPPREGIVAISLGLGGLQAGSGAPSWGWKETPPG